jgi:hypothetical protein
MIEFGRRLNANVETARLFLFIAVFVGLSGMAVGTWEVAAIGGGALLTLVFSQVAAGIADGRAEADRLREATLHPWVREGRAALRELPAGARADARPVLDSLERYVSAVRCAPHDEHLAAQARERLDALVELRDSYRSLRAHELVGPEDDTDVVTARLMAAQVRELAAELDQL